MHEKILLELKEQLEQRGEVTKEQREYARVEVELMEKMYPLREPWEEQRLACRRTLDSYIVHQDIKTILHGNGISLSIN